MTHARDVMASSKDPNWRTPQWLYEDLHAEFGFALDAAADAASRKHEKYLGPDSEILDDALSGVPWDAIVRDLYGIEGEAPLHQFPIFLNPPYSKELHRAAVDLKHPNPERFLIETWVKMAAETGTTTVPVVAIIPYSPQTIWWRRHVEGSACQATEIRQFPFRIKFDPSPEYTGKASGSNVNHVVVVWRPLDGFGIQWSPLRRYWRPKSCPYRNHTIERDDD